MTYDFKQFDKVTVKGLNNPQIVEYCSCGDVISVTFNEEDFLTETIKQEYMHKAPEYVKHCYIVNGQVDVILNLWGLNLNSWKKLNSNGN